MTFPLLPFVSPGFTLNGKNFLLEKQFFSLKSIEYNSKNDSRVSDLVTAYD